MSRHDHDGDTGDSRNPQFQEIVARRMSRRSLVAALAASGATLAIGASLPQQLARDLFERGLERRARDLDRHRSRHSGGRRARRRRGRLLRAAGKGIVVHRELSGAPGG